jgi:clan AA aspartic protease
MRLLGRVSGAFPRAELTLAFPAGPQVVEFVVDTGFEGELALPPRFTRQLGRPSGQRLVELADGSHAPCSLYELEMKWEDQWHPTTVLELAGNPLLGVELLYGYHLQVEMEDGGEVVIEPL